MEKQGFDSWAIVELMGHTRIAGKVTEAEIGGGKLLRVDVPEVEGKQAITKYFGSSAVYALTPVDEETARMVASAITIAPIAEWSAREMVKRVDAEKALPASSDDSRGGPDDEEDEEEEEDEAFPF